MSIIPDWIPDWSSLRQFGENKLLRTSYFWMIFTPIAAKILERLPESISVVLNGHVIDVTLGLPFKWTLFFFGSVFASVANMVYSLKCPKIVKNYDDYAAFSSEGRGVETIKSALLQTVLKNFRIEDTQSLSNAKHFHDTYGQGGADQVNLRGVENERAKAMTVVNKTKIDVDKGNEAFWYVRDLASGMSPWWRFFCSLFFLISFGLFGYVLLENIYYVGKIALHQIGAL